MTRIFQNLSRTLLSSISLPWGVHRLYGEAITPNFAWLRIANSAQSLAGIFAGFPCPYNRPSTTGNPSWQASLNVLPSLFRLSDPPLLDLVFLFLSSCKLDPPSNT